MTWPDVEGFIASALKHSKGEFNIDQAKAMVVNGLWTLLVGVEDGKILGAATLNFFNRPDARVAFVTAIGGKMIGNVDTFKQLKLFAASNGASVIEGAARDSVARLWRRFGFVTKYQIVGVRI